MRTLSRLLAAATVAAIVAFAAPAQAARHPKPVASAAAATGSLVEFSTESAAQAHCPSDTVVWLNTKSRIYHEKGMRWYGRTKQGAYVCRREANAAGNRDTRNGQ